MKRFKKAIVLILLCCLSVSLGGAICARAAISDDVGVRWWRMNKAHEGAEIARALGGDNAAALAYFGERWTTANNERKDLEAQATPTPTQRLEYLGNYQLTAYEYGTGPNSYNGKSQTLNHTVASDSIPGGTWIYIEVSGNTTSRIPASAIRIQSTFSLGIPERADSLGESITYQFTRLLSNGGLRK